MTQLLGRESGVTLGSPPARPPPHGRHGATGIMRSQDSYMRRQGTGLCFRFGVAKKDESGLRTPPTQPLSGLGSLPSASGGALRACRIGAPRSWCGSRKS